MAMRFSSVSSTIAALAWALGVGWPTGTYAEIYKWVDEKGVTNYSSALPASGKARTLAPGAAAVSVYPAPPPRDAERTDAAMQAKIERLENELLAERRVRQTSTRAESDRRRLTYEQCLRDRRVDCDLVRDGLPATDYFTPYFAVAAPFVLAGRPFLPPRRMRAGLRPVFGAVPRFHGRSQRTAGHRGSRDLLRQGR